VSRKSKRRKARLAKRKAAAERKAPGRIASLVGSMSKGIEARADLLELLGVLGASYEGFKLGARRRIAELEARFAEAHERCQVCSEWDIDCDCTGGPLTADRAMSWDGCGGDPVADLKRAAMKGKGSR
jgi:hypothetical protein